MIHRFRTIIPHVLYRGSAPSPQDVKHLKDKYGIKKIVSLDEKSGERIARTCKLLGIHQTKLYINGDERKSLLHFLSQDLRKAFLTGGPTFLHCLHGKDRSSLAAALIECKFLHKSPEQTLKEAKKLGFGVGVAPHIISLYERIIRNCKPSRDQNSADIVSNEREYIGDNRDSFLDEAHMSSFSPYLDPTREYPYTANQGDTRDNYDQPLLQHNQEEMNTVPTVGLFNNDAGLGAAGPTINMTGFLYE